MKAKFEKRQAADGGEAEVHNFGLPVDDGPVETTPPPRAKVEPKSTAEANLQSGWRSHRDGG